VKARFSKQMQKARHIYRGLSQYYAGASGAKTAINNLEGFMKIEWKKNDKQYYLPKGKPEVVILPSFRYFTISGEGNPNDPFFGDYISVLYSLSYAIKMSPKQGCAPENYVEYTVYPLEGIWDLTDIGRKNYNGALDKDEFKFKMMIRQPEFVTEEYAKETIERTMKKKPDKLLDQIVFESIEEGKCIQMLHIGSYDAEPESFRMMEEYAEEQNLIRIEKKHKEIYLSDPGKTAIEKLKTVLRFRVK